MVALGLQLALVPYFCLFTNGAALRAQAQKLKMDTPSSHNKVFTLHKQIALQIARHGISLRDITRPRLCSMTGGKHKGALR